MDFVTQNVPHTATFLLGGMGFLTVLYFLLRAIYNLYFHPLAKIPGHRAWSTTHIPLAWSIYRGTSVRKMQQLHRQYGPILRIGPDSVSFAQAEAWAQVLQPPPGSPETILKDTQWFRPLPGMVPSLSQAVEPSPHAHIKKAMLPAFTARALRAQEPFIQRYVNLLVDRLRDIASGDSSNFFVGGHEPAEVDIVSWLNFTTFDIFGDLGFGESFGCLEHSRHHPWVSIIFSNLKGIALLRAASYFPIVESLLTLCIPASIRKMQSDHVEFVRKKVQTRLNYEFKREDLMSCVYRAEGHPEFTGDHGRREKSEQEDGAGLSVEAITSVFWEMIMAGSETTATSLAGTINLVVQNPDKLRILADELRTRFVGETSESISLDELHDLPYLNAVLKEGLRLCAPFPWILPRVIPAGGRNICGAWLPEGTKVSIHMNAIHRHPSYFHDAEAFQPERWLPEALSDPRSSFFNDRRDASQPFLVGPRACIGQNLAWAEMRLILAKLVWSFDLGLPVDECMRVTWEDLKAYIVFEKPPIHVTLQPRPPVIVDGRET